MLLLHLSDIHFKHTVCGTPHIDPDTPYRNALIRDVGEMRTSIGSPVDAILVTGDIAYSGNEKEYATAIEWLKSLADVSGCAIERIFVVPGNHDVDRDVVTKNNDVRDSQSTIRDKKYKREDELWKNVGDQLRGQVLLTPIENYNNFAAKFECQHYFPRRIFWQQDLALDDQHTFVRIFGLTSTLLSGPSDAPNSLYLSPHQTVFASGEAAVTISMCHHPPDWLMDRDDVDESLCERVEIHLFGHKHRQRITREKRYLRFSAGAVSPDRAEAGWEPGYNLIELSVDDDGSARYLDVQAHLRVWQTNPNMFVEKLTESRETVFRERLLLTRMGIPCKRSDHTKAHGTWPTLPLIQDPQPTEVNVEAAMSDDRTRNIYFRLWDLPLSKRRKIFNKFSLLGSTDATKPDAEKCRKALLNANSQGILHDVVDEIEKMERE